MPDGSDKTAPRRLSNLLPTFSVVEKSIISQILAGNSPWSKKTPKQILLATEHTILHPVDFTGDVFSL